MTRAAVICEFNPFHNGHKFLLEKIKAEYNADVVCIMSGSFVQRGDIAITDKYSRAASALMNGAEMVVELPTVYAVASAQIFAENGVRIAADLGCELLCFGAENSLDELNAAVERIDSPIIQQSIAEKMKAGEYYPKALSESVGEAYAEMTGKPNNILALEYIRACKKYGVSPVAFQREGVEHNDTEAVGKYASASAIRALIRCGEQYTAYTPMTVESAVFLDAIEPVILFKLKTMSKDELALLPDVKEGLENRIYDHAVRYNSLKELLEHIKTKRYTMARIRRILLCALLDITEELQKRPVPYIRVLGIKQDKAELLRSNDLPLIIDVRRGYDLLNNSAKEIFNIDLKATEAMNIARKISINEFSRGVIKISS